MSPVLFKDGYLEYKCPACGHHSIPVKVGQKVDKHWEWNGDLNKPTIRPSVKHFLPESHYQQHPECPRYCCHYHITNGNIEFCGDCTHEHNGKSLSLEPYSEAEVKMHAMGR